MSIQPFLTDDPLLLSLSTVVQENKLVEKIILTDSLQSGRCLMNRLTRSGLSWANLFCETPASYAQKLIADEMAVQGIEPADSTMTFLLVSELVSSVPECTEYFSRVGESPGVLNAAHRVISELREQAVTSNQVGVDLFIDPEKGRTLIALLEAYERSLDERKWVDQAEILRMGTENLKTGSPEGALFLIPAGLFDNARGLLRRFLDALPGHQIRVLQLGLSNGLGIPAGDMGGTPVSPKERPAMFSAAGFSAEVSEVLRRVLQSESPLEEVVVLSSGDDTFLRTLGNAAARLRMPMTSSSGWPISTIRPGRAALAYLQWVREDFLVRPLSDALAAGDFVPPGGGGQERVSGTACARILRSSGIGWGRERYRPALQAEVERLGGLLAQKEDVEAEIEASRGRADRRKRVEAVLVWVNRLLDLTPTLDMNGRMSFPELCRAVGAVAQQFGPVASPEEATALARITDTMETAALWGTGEYDPEDAVDRVLALVAPLRVGSSGPRPGAIHVTSLDSAWPVGRKHVFLAGLDENAIGTRPSSDPLLLDEERAAFERPLPDSRELKSGSLARLNWSLGQLRGNLTLSYSVRSPGSDRESFPSPLLLTAYRLQSGPNASYDDLMRALGRPVGYFPDSDGLRLSRDEAWLSHVGRQAAWADAEESALAAYPHLARGRLLVDARASDRFTEFDGRIDPAPELHDPRRNHDTVLSASRLELLAKCPLGYFYRYGLEVAPPDEPIRDSGTWLDALARGEALHDVYRLFYRRLGGRPQGAPVEEELMRSVCEEVLQGWRRKTPPPSEAVFAREERDIVTSALCFLSMERMDDSRAVPTHFEVPFGFGPESIEPGRLGCADPIPVALSDGTTFLLRGRIDRIDRVGPHEYHIWDYKTGRPFAEGGTVVRGRRLQHALYARAAEALLRGPGEDPAAHVTRSGYRFPTVRGETSPIWVAETDCADPMDRAVRWLLGLVAAGAFPAAEDAASGYRCAYCDYAAACADQPSAATKRKMKAGDPLLGLFAEVIDID